MNQIIYPYTCRQLKNNPDQNPFLDAYKRKMTIPVPLLYGVGNSIVNSVNISQIDIITRRY